MHWKDGAHAGTGMCELLFHTGRIEIQGFRINVGKNRRRPGASDGAGGSKEAERSSNDLMARANTGGRQRQPQRVCAGGASYRVLSATDCRKFVLKGSNFVTENVTLRIANPLYGGKDLRADGGILA